MFDVSVDGFKAVYIRNLHIICRQIGRFKRLFNSFSAKIALKAITHTPLLYKKRRLMSNVFIFDEKIVILRYLLELGRFLSKLTFFGNGFFRNAYDFYAKSGHRFM